MTQQACGISMPMENWSITASRVIIDHDAEFTQRFDAVFAANVAEVRETIAPTG